MNRPKTMLGSSVSILIVAVIAIVAFVRGKWELPLLIAAFVLWGIWLVWKLLVPAWREARRQRDNALLADWTPMEAPGTAAPDPALANLLLLHVNHRISGCLLSYYPNARWEWLVNDPVQFVVSRGTARIRVYGIPAYEYADITLDGSVKAGTWISENFSKEEREYLKADYALLPLIGKAAQSIGEERFQRILFQFLFYRYFNYELDQLFLPQYHRNTQSLKALLDQACSGSVA